MERHGLCSTCDWFKGCVLNSPSKVLDCEEFSSRRKAPEKPAAAGRAFSVEETPAE